VPARVPMRVFLFLAVRAPDLTARLLEASARSQATVILDLEDALWDADDPVRTARLKADGREHLVALVDGHPGLFADRRIGLRINAVSSPEAALDLAMLATIGDAVDLDCLVLPKVGGAADVESAVAAGAAGRLRFGELIPIVETRRGLSNLDPILAAARAAGSRNVVYGHYDLALDSGWWPIPGHHDPAFWVQAEPIIERIEAHGLGYVHPPYMHLHDEAGLARVVERLARTCRRGFGILTVGLRQAASAARLADEDGRPPNEGGIDASVATDVPEALREDDPIELASWVVETFRRNRRADTGFALDPRSGEFISPHVYLAARRALEEHGGA
jgi:citrate lyase subunit beta / citryl-CoA lyase